MPTHPLSQIEQQIAAAAGDLGEYRPVGVDWSARCLQTASRLVPALHAATPRLRDFVAGVLNAPSRLRELWAMLRLLAGLPRDHVEAFDRYLALDNVIREAVTGEVVSRIVTHVLLDAIPALAANGRSDYPDLFLADIDYSGLPTFRRARSESDEVYGASLKGPHRRPARVPDGLEIKTCRKHIRVDCHHPHVGLHLALVYSGSPGTFSVDDVRIAFLRVADYRASARNTTATTFKYSFGGERFVSLLHAG